MSADSGSVFTAGRVEAFSDGVFAIVITLLVLEIKAPELSASAGAGEALRALATLAPKFAGFFLSFLFIAVFWVSHHRFFALVRRVDGGLLWLNNLLLLLMCFIPFPTAFVGDHPKNPVALALFALVLLSSSTTFNLMWRHARRRRLSREHLPEALIRRAILRGLVGPAGYAVAAGAGFLSPAVSWTLFILIPFFYALPFGGAPPGAAGAKEPEP